MECQREDVEFYSGTAICHAWLYRPLTSSGGLRPCIMMAHGLGGTRDAGLEPYALKFADAGYAVLLFDYRHFGASDGEPRQLLSVKRQLKDWTSAIGYARSLPGIDPAKIALWGTSFSGGHVIVAAARDGRVAAVSAQGPMMDTIAATRSYLRTAGFFNFLKSGVLGGLDLIRAILGMSPIYVPLVGSPRKLAAMCSVDAVPGYGAITPPHWRNQICARYVLTMSGYRPIAHAAKLPCPALIQVCMQDNLVPASSAVATARKIGAQAELKQYECGHFDIYVGEYFERASNEQLAFFNRVLAQGNFELFDAKRENMERGKWVEDRAPRPFEVRGGMMGITTQVENMIKSQAATNTEPAKCVRARVNSSSQCMPRLRGTNLSN